MTRLKITRVFTIVVELPNGHVHFGRSFNRLQDAKTELENGIYDSESSSIVERYVKSHMQARIKR